MCVCFLDGRPLWRTEWRPIANTFSELGALLTTQKRGRETRSPQCCFHPGLGAFGTVANFLHGTGLRKSVTYIAMYLVSRMQCKGLSRVGFCQPCDAMTT
jgi:hypothetical protein